MERLSSMDALWMSIEKDGPPLAIGGLVVVAGPVPTLEEYREFVGARAAGRMRQRLVPGTLRLRQPKWEDAEPDLSHHVRELVLPAPGGETELQEAVAQISCIRMDPELPLWDSTLITGLPDDTWGLVTRLHHTVADGQGAMALTGAMMDIDPAGTTSLAAAMEEMTRNWRVSQEAQGGSGGERNTIGMLAEAAQKGGDLMLRALRTVTSVSAAGEAVEAARDAASRTVEALGSHMPGVPGPLAGDPGKERSWALTTVRFTDIKVIRSQLGGTVNDVVMALMSGGFKRVVDRLGEDDDHVRVMIPLSLRTAGDPTANNQVSFLLVVLPLGGSAANRLTDILEHINSIKDLNLASLGVPAQTIVDRTVPAFVQTFAVSNLTGRLTGGFVETLVTNVPGPQFPLYIAGRRVQLMAPLIPLGVPMRLNTGIVSYNGVMHFGISGGEGMIDAVQDVAAGIQETLADLLAAAAADQPPESKGQVQ